jgi:hypothetical protein
MSLARNAYSASYGIIPCSPVTNSIAIAFSVLTPPTPCYLLRLNGSDLPPGDCADLVQEQRTE